jgi:hypothetical protein
MSVAGRTRRGPTVTSYHVQLSDGQEFTVIADAAQRRSAAERERWLIGDCGGATGIVAVQHDTAFKLLTRANRFDDRLYQRLRLTTNCCTLYGAFVVVFH